MSSFLQTLSMTALSLPTLSIFLPLPLSLSLSSNPPPPPPTLNLHFLLTRPLQTKRNQGQKPLTHPRRMMSHFQESGGTPSSLCALPSTLILPRDLSIPLDGFNFSAEICFKLRHTPPKTGFYYVQYRLVRIKLSREDEAKA